MVLFGLFALFFGQFQGFHQETDRFRRGSAESRGKDRGRDTEAKEPAQFCQG